MNRGQKAIRRDKRSWRILAVVFALTAVLGVMRMIEGSGDVVSMLIPLALTALCWYMSRWTGEKQPFRRK